jgi:hypothetical protein
MKAECIVTARVAGPCGVCGMRAEPCHLPANLDGFFCGACCPACRPPRPAFDDRDTLQPVRP